MCSIANSSALFKMTIHVSHQIYLKDQFNIKTEKHSKSAELCQGSLISIFLDSHNAYNNFFFFKFVRIRLEMTKVVINGKSRNSYRKTCLSKPSYAYIVEPTMLVINVH